MVVPDSLATHKKTGPPQSMGVDSLAARLAWRLVPL